MTVANQLKEKLEVLGKIETKMEWLMLSLNDNVAQDLLDKLQKDIETAGAAPAGVGILIRAGVVEVNS